MKRYVRSDVNNNKNQKICAASYESKMLWEQAEDIADRLSVFLDATGRIANLEDWLDEYDIDHLGKAMDCLYDFAQMYSVEERGVFSGCRSEKKKIESSQEWPPEETYNEFEEGDQLIQGFINALEEMDLMSEPSGYGNTYTDFILNIDTGEEVARIPGKEEIRKLTRFFNASTSVYDYKDKIKKWIRSLQPSI